MAAIDDEEALFNAAADQAPAERAAFLDEACAGRPALRRRVEALLSAYGDGDCLHPPMATALHEPIGHQPGDHIGPYKLLEQIGEGGMGLVFMAEQSAPLRRRVALKIIKPGLDTRAVIARFDAERQALALMDHPNIARVYDAGATDTGRPYFVMELVRGQPITDYCRQRDLPLRERLTLFIEVCQAVQHAHQKGIIHRDLKPTNILVAQSDTAPVPKVIDFGVAKATTQPLTDRTLFTAFSQIIGTPLYMSPEQADLGNQDVDTRSDVYSLGVVLYELLAGTTPFDEERLRSVSHDEMRRIIREEEPPRPSTRLSQTARPSSGPLPFAGRVEEGETDAAKKGAAIVTTIAERRLAEPRRLIQTVRGDLDWIVMKALEKDRRRRYESPSALVADIDRYLEGQSVLARRPSMGDRLVKWSRRHVGLIWSALAAALLIAAALGVSTAVIAESRDAIGQQRQIAIVERNAAEDERNVALEERKNARLAQYYAEVIASEIAVEQQNIGGARAMLVGHLPVADRPDNRGWEWHYLMSRCRPELRTLKKPTRYIFAAWNPDGTLIGGQGVVWDDKTSARLVNLEPSRILTTRVAWSPDGNRLAWGAAEDDKGIYIWDRPTNGLKRLVANDTTESRDKSVWCVDWSPNGKQLASGGTDCVVKIWDMDSGSVVRTMPTKQNVMNVAWRPDGAVLAAASVDGDPLRTFNPRTGEVLAEFSMSGSYCSVDWSPDGRQLYFANDTSWYVLAAEDLSVQQTHSLSRGGSAVACSPDGAKLAVTDGESIAVWDLKANRLLAEFHGHLTQVVSVAWSPDGNRLLSGSYDGEAKTWSLAKRSTSMRVDAPITALQWNSDDLSLRAVSQSKAIAFDWTPGAEDPVRKDLPRVADSLCSSRDGRFAAVNATESTSRAIEVIDAVRQQTVAVLTLPKGHELWPNAYAFSDDGARLALVTRLKNQMFLTAWDVGEERALSTWRWERLEDYARAKQPTWSPDGRLLALVTVGDIGDSGTPYWSDHVNVIEVATGCRILKHHPAGQRSPTIKALVWDQLSNLVAIGTEEGRVEVLEPATQKLVFSQKIHGDAIHALAWHPDSKRLISSSTDGTIKLIAMPTGQSLLTFKAPEEIGAVVAWSPDGHRLAAVSPAGEVEVWDASRGYDMAAAGKRRGELAWEYFDRADNSSGEEARLALREALRHAPDTLDFWTLRGQARAMLGEFDQASEEFSKLAGPDYRRAIISALDLARCYLAAHRMAEYRDVCASLVASVSDEKIVSSRRSVIHCCVISPVSSIKPDALLRMAPDASESTGTIPDRSADFYLGACQLRQGQYAEAARLLAAYVGTIPSGTDEAGAGELARAKLMMALCRCRSGQTQQARRLLAEANHHASQAGDLQWNWRLRVDLDVLRTEVSDALSR